MRETLSTFLVWVALLACYLLFAGQLGLQEVGVGMAAALLLSGFTIFLRRCETRQIALRNTPWARVMVKSLISIPLDALRVGHILLATAFRRPDHACGTVQNQPFRRGLDDADDAARRAVVILGVSLAPNGFVLDISGTADSFLVHRLRPVPPVSNREWPV